LAALIDVHYAGKQYQKSWHDQMNYYVYSAIRRTFKDVVFAPWMTNLPLKGKDILVTFMPNPNVSTWKRTILIDNSNFDVNKWNHGTFVDGGFSTQISDDFKHAYDEAMANVLGQIILSNDVAIEKCRIRDPSVQDFYEFIMRSNERVYVVPHPIDKGHWSKIYDEAHFPHQKMLIYHAGQRKNSAQLIEMMTSLGYIRGQHFDVTDYIRKDNLEELRSTLSGYSIFANCSYSETGPVNLLEFLINGQLIYGHSAWWDGCGYPFLQWSYDPAKMQMNKSNIRFLLNPDNHSYLHSVRNSIHKRYMARTDNKWAAVTDIVVKLIRENL